MRDQHAHAVGHELGEAQEHLVLRARIECRGRLIEDQQLRVAHVGARQRDLLPFAARQVDPLLEPPAKHLPVTRGEARQQGGRKRLVRRVDQLDRCVAIGAVVEIAPHRLDLAHPDVLVEAHVVPNEILEDHADLATQRCQIVVAKIDPIEQDPAFGGVVEPGEQLRQRRLAGAILADERDALARTEREAHVPHGPSLAPRVAKADVLEHEAVPNRRRHRRRARLRCDRRLHLEEQKQVAQVQPLFVDGARAEEKPLDEIAAA